jgi:nucleotide-binding universal stress UspA family protein
MASKKILVPTDFSDAGRNASEYAVELAKAMQYDVVLFHVFNTPVVVSNDVMSPMMVDTVQIEKDIKVRLKEEATFLQLKHNIEVAYESADGMIVDEILEAERAHEPAFIVMGMREAGALSEYILGSTSTDIMLRIHSPLLIVPEKAVFKKIERVVFTHAPHLNLKVEICPDVKDLFERFYSTVYILSVLSNEETAEHKKPQVDEQLEKHFENRFHSYHFVENDDVVDGINEFIEKHQIDLVTMLPQKHNFLERLFKEPYTKRLAFHSHIPLLTLICNKDSDHLKST